jgi:sporulation protein YlmC with PRC-barrel domain
MARFRRASDLSAAVALSASLLTAIPALAQSNAPSGSSNNGSASTNTMQLGEKAPSGGLVKTHDDWRASGLVGATVYNDQGDSIGTVNDLLLSSDGTIQNAVISVGGFLGIGSKLVAVPFKNIKFAPSKSNPASGSKQAIQANAPSTALPATAPASNVGAAGTPGVPAPASGAGTASSSAPAAGIRSGPTGGSGASATPASHEYSLVLPGATKASLTADPAFQY